MARKSYRPSVQRESSGNINVWRTHVYVTRSACRQLEWSIKPTVRLTLVSGSWGSTTVGSTLSKVYRTLIKRSTHRSMFKRQVFISSSQLTVTLHYFPDKVDGNIRLNCPRHVMVASLAEHLDWL